jgi:glycosyltransferase involved in cell wall biosynthesis
MSQPHATALIGTYNQGRFLAEAIESVLSQDFPAAEMEVLLVDDGSTDAAPEIAARYSDRVRYIRKANGGQASVFNLGFAEARGEIIAMLDGDDVWLPGKLRAMVEEFERHPEAGLVYHPYQIWDPVKGLCFNTEFHPVSGFVPDRLADLLTYGDFGTCGMALRKAALQRILPVPETLAVYADLYIVCLMIFVAPVAARAEHLTRYRQHENNLTSFTSADRARQQRRWNCYAEGMAQVRAWLARNGFDAGKPEIAAFLRHQELGGIAMRFELDPPGRAAYFRYLREHARVHRTLWTPGYRAFQWTTSLAALALGYRRYEALRAKYRGAKSLRELRAAWIRDEKPEVAAIPAHAPQQAAGAAGGARG